MDFYTITSEEILERISRHCPKALSAYLQCINRSGEDGRVYFTRKMVENDMSERWVPFKNNIKLLALENLLEWHELDGGISISLAEVIDV